MKKVFAALAGVLAFACTSVALAGTVTLHPNSSGQQTVAAWRAGFGLADTVGAANQALLLEKDGFDLGTAATAEFTGIAESRAQLLAGLDWERRVDTDCTKTSPRWTLVVQGAKKPRQYVVRFGCAQSAHAPGSAPGWIRDVNSQTLIRTRLLQAGGSDALGGTIVSLAIVFDERGETGQAVLDNIRLLSKSKDIGSNMWTSAADNAQGVPGGPSDVGRDDLSVNPLSASEQMSLEEIWPTMTPEDQATASSDVWVDG